MRFLPLTRQVQLEESSPEKLIYASPNTLFYRVGDDVFYLIKDNAFERIEVSKKSFALKYKKAVIRYLFASRLER